MELPGGLEIEVAGGQCFRVFWDLNVSEEGCETFEPEFDLVFQLVEPQLVFLKLLANVFEQ